MKKLHLKPFVALLMSVLMISPSVIPSLAVPFDGAPKDQIRTYDAKILKTVDRADSVLAYSKGILGDGEHRLGQSEYQALQKENQTLQRLLNTKDSKAIANQIDKVEGGIIDLLNSKTKDEDLIVEVPQEMMGVSANSFQPDYPPENAIDGDPNSMWHSQWAPDNTPFPHILTIDLHKKTVLNDITIWPRQDATAGRITKGQIYAGDSLDDMKPVADFTDDAGQDAAVVNLHKTTARYVQIYSLEATSANTAVSEIKVTSFYRPVVDVPKTMMSASANSSNSSCPPVNAIDGNRATLWHSEWTPQDDPFPHILTIDLHKKMMLDVVSILPRQDANAGKTTSGQIYAGDSLDDMKLVTDFTGDSSRNATVVDMDYTSARYIQIYSLEASSANTAIAEVVVSTYDLALVEAFNQYDLALDMLRKSTVGDGVGAYSSSDTDAFQKVIEGFSDELNQEELTPADYAAIVEKIRTACADFSAKAKAYSKADLASLIKSFEKQIAGIQIAVDKASADALLVKANGVSDDPNATREDIHTAYTQVSGFMKSMDAVKGDNYDLAGEWKLSLSAYSGDLQPTDKVTLPGTLDTNKKGNYNAYEDINRLSRYFTYTGPATYQMDVYISGGWSDKNIVLYMERSRQTSVWVNGVEVESPETSNVLPASQRYNLSGALQYGKYNTIAITVDNTYTDLPKNGISNSHMATDETQTNWNGIVGAFSLQINNKAYMEDLRVYPNQDLTSVTVEADLVNNADAAYNGVLTLQCAGAEKRNINVSLAAGEKKTFTVSDYAMPKDVKLWSEFETPLYEMTASLDNGGRAQEKFGMRRFHSEDSRLTINGKTVFLRNESNCAVFPLTGYAPMDEESWKDLFTAYKSYGINSVRFHSWCPPEAAFSAADQLGLYLQPELSCWDGPMLGDEVRRNYYRKEAFAIIKEYANHPSFVMMTFGNELSYQGNDYIEQGDRLISELQQKDSTRLYAPGSNVAFGSVDPAPHADFYTAERFLNSNFRGSYGGLNGHVNQQYPSSMVNYDDAVAQLAELGVPSFSFEVGQYQVFPDVLSEPQKYTGVLDARNFKLIAENLKEKGFTETDVRRAIEASGMLSRIGYKAEIEAARRTAGMSGISLLGIQDFSGQGTALVGMMNALGESKPYDFADPEAFSSFFSPVAPLFETSKFCWTNEEKLTGSLLLSNYAQDDVKGEISYKLTEKDGSVFYEGKTKSVLFKQGELTGAGEISISLGSIQAPTQLKLEIACQDAHNSYDFWVYPTEDKVSDGEVYITEYLDDIAIQILDEGGKVFLSPKASKTALPDSLEGRFSTAFWSTYDQSQPGTMGLLLDPEHPLFEAFPTDYYSNYQWWAMSRYGRPMNLEALKNENGERIEPLVKVIDGFANLNNMGLLYEAAVGNGKLVVSSMGLDQLEYEYPEAKALRNAIIRYMNSDNFDPSFQVDIEKVKAQVQSIPGEEKENLASKYKGGQPFLGEHTETCQGGYDRDPVDRMVEINDGIVDLSSSSRSWTDFRGDQTYPHDAQIGVELAGGHTVDSVAFAFFEDPGCKAPASIRIQYWDGEGYRDVVRPDATKDFQPGMNTITFTPVETDKLLFTMEHHEGMAVAISEMFVYEKQVDPDRIYVETANDRDVVELTETLEFSIKTRPVYANNRLVKWSVEDASGKPSALAKIGFDGVLHPLATGKVTVRATLRSNPEVTATREITIVKTEIVPGDLNKDGKVTVTDVMEACRVLARKSAGQKPTDDEIARGDLNGNHDVDITDVMEICRKLVRKD